MNKAFKYRLYPNEEQINIITKTFGCCRFIYNKMLADKINFYKEHNAILNNTPSQYKCDFEWLKEVDSLALANEQINLQKAYSNFFRGIQKKQKIGFPKFKSKKYSKKHYTTNNVNNNIRINNNKIILPKLGLVRFEYYRLIPKHYKIKSVTISQTSSNKYFISILTEYEYEIPNRKLDKNKSLGLDYSSKNFYIDNQNRKGLNEHFYRQSEDKLAKEQRKLSHMKLHSNNYEKQRIKVAKVHEKITNKRKDFIEKESTKLANLYDIICIEDIDMKNISQCLHLGKSTMDNAFGIFRVRLEQKLLLQGKKLIIIDKWFPSSKMCNICGCINETLRLSDREWDCGCGTHHNRDENAAINILNEGLRILNL